MNPMLEWCYLAGKVILVITAFALVVALVAIITLGFVHLLHQHHLSAAVEYAQ